MDKFFDKKYSVELPKLVRGRNEEAFEIDRSFFDEFAYSPIESGELKIAAVFVKYETHLDATFDFDGTVELSCDRCMEPYPHALSFSQRVIFSYDQDIEFDTDEVILLDQNEPRLLLAKDFYDFILLQIPLRKVPTADIHLCAPRVMEMLGLNPDGSPKTPEAEKEPSEEEGSEEPVDPRWAELKKLKESGTSETEDAE